MKQSEDHKFIPMTSVSSRQGYQVKADVFYYTNQIVNLVFIGESGSDWVLIDAGMPYSAKEIIGVAEERFGKGCRPKAILLTHGHFDHVGSIVDLIKAWNVPVYAHVQELPFLTGLKDYPEPDATVEGGLLAKISMIYPNEAINISEAVYPLPEDHSVPYLPGWQWIHTPGHSPGHVSFFRPGDKTLVAGDAFVTVRQDSLYKVLLQKEEVNGPPRYLTTDWDAAKNSVLALRALDPELAITGHGKAMLGDVLRKGLKRLCEDFDTIALPKHGKYVDKSGKDEDSYVYE